MTFLIFVILINCIYLKLTGPFVFGSDGDKKLERVDKTTSFLK